MLAGTHDCNRGRRQHQQIKFFIAQKSVNDATYTLDHVTVMEIKRSIFASNNSITISNEQNKNYTMHFNFGLCCL